MKMFSFALLTVLVSVGSCSVTWDDLRSFLDDDRLEKRDTKFVDSTSPVTCPAGKAAGSISLSNGKLGISCDRNVASSQCWWTDSSATNLSCWSKEYQSWGIVAGIEQMGNMWKFRCCRSPGGTAVMGGGLAGPNGRHDVPSDKYLCFAVIMSGSNGKISRAFLGHSSARY